MRRGYSGFFKALKVWAPGRVNLIGEHTDYSGGLVLPAAIQLGLTLQIRSRSDTIKLDSAGFASVEPFAADGSGLPVDGWGRFGQAVAAELAVLGRPPIGMEAVIASNLPAGRGLSSSAALEVGIGLGLCAVADFDVEPLVLADVCRRAEERAVGVPCGILDQAACLLGEDRAAVLIDCGSLDHRRVPIPESFGFLIVDSGVERRLEHTGYADRRRELERARSLIGGTITRETSLADLERLDPLSRRRIRHVVTENERVRRFAAALSESDLQAAGELMSASHASLRDDYDVSLPEVNEVAATVEECGAHGARLVGGGFGGAVLALVEAARADEVARAVSRALTGLRPPIVVQASAGARVDSPRRG